MPDKPESQSPVTGLNEPQDNRRQSLRISARLPFAWRRVSEDCTAAELPSCFHPDRPAAHLDGLADQWQNASDQFHRDLTAVVEPATRQALESLSKGLHVLHDLIHDLCTSPPPPVHRLNLGADGIGFDCVARPEANPHGNSTQYKLGASGIPALGDRLGIEIGFPNHSARFGFARIVHIEGAYLGAELERPAGDLGKAMSRYILRHRNYNK